MLKTAEYFEKLDDNKVICRLCPAHCKLTDGKLGICRSRYNREGTLVTDNYGELVSLAIDPIEKKPLYHFYPGADILSTGPNCCNLGCLHCQNWGISQEPSRTTYMSPEDLAEAASKRDSIGVAFTYTEPMVWYEYIMDVAPLLKSMGLKVVLVSNGYIDPAPLDDFMRVSDAMNIDLKGIDPQFYKKICKGQLKPVLDNIREIGRSDVHLEVTNLIIPGENDSVAVIQDLVDFVASVSPRIPLHLSAYYPSYKMDHEPTPLPTMLRAAEIARKSLDYVYLGNVRVSGWSDTICPDCGAILIERSGYRTHVRGLENGSCAACGCKTSVIQ